jgi:hypothetical protein
MKHKSTAPLSLTTIVLPLQVGPSRHAASMHGHGPPGTPSIVAVNDSNWRGRELGAAPPRRPATATSMASRCASPGSTAGLSNAVFAMSLNFSKNVPKSTRAPRARSTCGAVADGRLRSEQASAARSASSRACGGDRRGGGVSAARHVVTDYRLAIE